MTTTEPIKQYIAELNAQFRTGVAHEHSYRGPLQNLLGTLLPKGHTVVNEPTREKCGAPDYIILKGNIPVAYIEAKDLFDNDLDGRKEHREQFDRYKSSLDHIVFTNYLDFHLYENGEYTDGVHLAEVRGDKIVLENDSADKFIQLIDRLANAVPQRITFSSRLATMMAGKARLLANVIEQALANDEGRSSELAAQLKVFQEFLIHDLNEKTFADIYAQTIAYGLFSARLNDPTPEDFSRTEANELIPKSNPFLRRIFNDIAGYNVDSRIAWIIDDLVEVFRVTDMTKVMRGFGGTSGRTDPMMHFYEDFLGQYDSALRDKRGVYYTPQPVVDFIVRAVDDLLKRDFDLPMGLADNSKIEHKIKNDWYRASKTKGDTKTISETTHRVQILDPATGTGTFLATVIRQIHANMEGQWGVWNDYVEQHLLPRLNGFELMMAPYTIAHLKLNMVLRETGYTSNSDKRLRVYLTNSLEEHNADTGTLFAAAISQEASEASRIKCDTPVMVMMGNPPYSVSSSNNSEWILQLIDDYKKNLNERKINLNDDYIKFIRLGQDYIQRNGDGILAFITNNSFIDGITHRQMRHSLMYTFDTIYILNLHGNSIKQETSPDGTADENVFDIMQGVSINIFVKTGKKGKDKLARVFFRELYGKREEKYVELSKGVIYDNHWSELNPIDPYYFFVPKDFSLEEEYKKGFAVNELFIEGSTGIESQKDSFCLCHNKDVLVQHLKDLQSLPEHLLREKYNLGPDGRNWKVAWAKEDVGNSIDERKIISVETFPFDTKFTYYTMKTNGFLAWPRNRSLSHMLYAQNISLIVPRQTSQDWRHVFLSSNITNGNILASAKLLGAGVQFPLWVYPAEGGSIFGENGEIRKPNLDKEIWDKINASVGEETTPEGVFNYIYAMLHSPAYRIKYKEFLKIDFPRIPYPANATEFHRLSAIGNQLRQLHLMEDLPQSKYAQFNTPGDNLVDKPTYKDGCVWINKEQCFADVPEVAWNFYIGGYQPAQKWLKDRRGCTLGFEDVKHYQRIIYVLTQTARIMDTIDA